MKRLNRGAVLRVIFLILASGLLFQGIIERWTQYSDSRMAATANELAARAGAKLVEVRLKMLLREGLSLNKMEQKIPVRDGYGWINELLRSRHPRLRFSMDPADFSVPQIIGDPDYCNGIFHIHGSGTLADLFSLLRVIETEMPYARVQDFAFQMNEHEADEIKFNLSLLAVMRMEGKGTIPE